MERLHNKLNSEAGVSILYAIMFMLVGFMVSAVILASASSSLDRMHNDEVWRQERLTLNSAGELLRNLLDQTSFDLSEANDGMGQPTMVADGDGPLGGVLEDKIASAIGYTKGYNPQPTGGSFVITVDSSSVDFEDVRVSYDITTATETVSGEVDEEVVCIIEATLAVDSTDANRTVQQLYLTAPASLSNDKLSWKKQNITVNTFKELSSSGEGS